MGRNVCDLCDRCPEKETGKVGSVPIGPLLFSLFSFTGNDLRFSKKGLKCQDHMNQGL